MSQTTPLAHFSTHNHTDFKMEPMSPETGGTALCNVPAPQKPVKTKRYSRPRGRCRSPTFVQKLKKTRRVKANDRERNRMHSLNSALERLRLHLPQNPDESKLTKIETLRLSITYIEKLTELLHTPSMDTADQEMPYGRVGGTETNYTSFPLEQKVNVDTPYASYPENLESLLSGMYWSSAESANASWCNSESSDDSAAFDSSSFQFDGVSNFNTHNGLQNNFNFIG